MAKIAKRVYRNAEGGATGCVVAALVCICITVGIGYFAEASRGGWMCVGFIVFGFILAVCGLIATTRDREPKLIIDETGIHDRRPGELSYPWKNIQSLSVAKPRGRNRRRVIALGIIFWDGIALHTGIEVLGLDATLEEIIAAIQEVWEQVKARRTEAVERQRDPNTVEDEVAAREAERERVALAAMEIPTSSYGLSRASLSTGLALSFGLMAVPIGIAAWFDANVYGWAAVGLVVAVLAYGVSVIVREWVNAEPVLIMDGRGLRCLKTRLTSAFEIEWANMKRLYVRLEKGGAGNHELAIEIHWLDGSVRAYRVDLSEIGGNREEIVAQVEQTWERFTDIRGDDPSAEPDDPRRDFEAREETETEPDE